MYVGIKHSNEYIEKYFTYGLKKNNKQLSMVPYFLSLAVFLVRYVNQRIERNLPINLKFIENVIKFEEKCSMNGYR